MAAFTGLLLLKKYKHTAARYFIYFLVYTVFVDFLGNYTNWDFFESLNLRLKGTIFERNYWWYHIFWTIGSAVFYSFYFSIILETLLYKKIVKYAGIIFFTVSALLISAFPELLFNGQKGYVASTTSVIVIFICVAFYFIEILKSDHILSFYKSINFYISVSILIWWLVTTPMTFYEAYFIKEDNDYVLLKRQVLLFSNIFMYLCFTFGLIYSRNKVNQ